MFNESTHGDYRIVVSEESKGDQYNKRNEVSNLQLSLLIWLNSWSHKRKKLSHKTVFSSNYLVRLAKTGKTRNWVVRQLW